MLTYSITFVRNWIYQNYLSIKNYRNHFSSRKAYMMNTLKVENWK
jgi:hypothetical protein